MGQYKRRVELQMTEEDYRLLVDKAESAGISKSEFVRRIIRGYVFPEKPDEEFMKMFYGLSVVGNSISIIAREAKEHAYIDKQFLKTQLDEMIKLKEELRNKYLPGWRK